MGFQFLLKSVTLDDTEGPLCTLVHHGFLNEDTHIVTGKNAGVLTV